MTSDQIRTVQSSWTKMRPIKAVAAQLFVERLIDADSSFACLTPGDTRRQGTRFMRLIDAAVTGLVRLDRNAALARRAGRRFAGCAITDRQVETIGVALIWTLGKGLGADFTAEAKDAWTTVYAELAATIRYASVAARRRDAFPARQPGLVNVA